MTHTVQDPDLAAADIEKIQRMIPHRYPLLLVDRVFNMVAGEACVGLKNVTMNEPFFQGHFPGRPVMPGVLVVEAMAQTAAVLVVHTLDALDNDLLVFFMTVDNCKFRRMVVPGDQLELHVSVARHRGNVWKFRGEAYIGGALAAEADFSAMISSPEDAPGSKG